MDQCPEPVLPAAGDAPDVQEQLVTLCRQHAERLEDNKQLQSSVRKLKHRLDQLQRETSGMETEHARTLLTRSQLEALCRELQTQNRAIKEESVVRVREESEKRRAVAAQFQTSLADISAMIAEGSQKNAKLTEENVSISNKLAKLCEQYEQKNTAVAEMMKQKELKSQLSDAQFAKLQAEMRKEREKSADERRILQKELAAHRLRYNALQATEAELKAQLETYSKRFDEIQEALAKSNGAFDTFKTDMEKMQKTVRRLEQESASWRQKCAANNQALLRMAEQKQAADAELLSQRRRLDTLQRLCHALESRAGRPAAPDAGGELSANQSSPPATVGSSSDSVTVSSSGPGPDGDATPDQSSSREDEPRVHSSDGEDERRPRPSEGDAETSAEVSSGGHDVRSSSGERTRLDRPLGGCDPSVGSSGGGGAAP